MLQFIAKVIAIVAIITSQPSSPQIAEIPENHVEYQEPTHYEERAEKSSFATYPMCGIVYALEYADDAVIVVTPDGELWEFYGCEDWAVGDICAMTFKDAGIPDYIWDDEIIETRYVGHDEGWE